MEPQHRHPARDRSRESVVTSLLCTKSPPVNVRFSSEVLRSHFDSGHRSKEDGLYALPYIGAPAIVADIAVSPLLMARSG